jgi:hypothetical protein
MSEAVQSWLALRVKDRDRVVDCTFERPNLKSGRSFGVTHGHFHENFGIESFRQLCAKKGTDP